MTTTTTTTVAQPLYMTRPVYAPAQYVPTLGGQKTDAAIPSYWSVLTGGLYWAYAGSPRAYALSGAGNGARFEVHKGDRNFADEATHTDCDRCELMGREDQMVKMGTPFSITFTSMFEPGDKNSASWLVFAQFHQDINTSKLAGSPPIAFELVGEKLVIHGRYGPNGLDGAKGNTRVTMFSDTADIVRGQRYKFELHGMFHPTGGHLWIQRDGKTIVNYSGPLGYDTMAGAYFAFGLYRATSPEVMAAQHGISAFNAGNITFPLV